MEAQRNDNMPEWGSQAFQAIVERAVHLSSREICDLLDLVGIRFRISREELEESPKEELIDYLHEADSLEKVEKFLKDHGV